MDSRVEGESSLENSTYKENLWNYTAGKVFQFWNMSRDVQIDMTAFSCTYIGRDQSLINILLEQKCSPFLFANSIATIDQKL